MVGREIRRPATKLSDSSNLPAPVVRRQVHSLRLNLLPSSPWVSMRVLAAHLCPFPPSLPNRSLAKVATGVCAEKGITLVEKGPQCK